MPSIYELTIPLLAMSACRIESPLEHKAFYKNDCAFFKANGERRVYLRESAISEFDLEMPTKEWLQVPILWCVVTQVVRGTHMVLPIWRGASFWPAQISDDSTVGLVLMQMQQRQGINLKEWLAFEQRVKADNTKVLTEASKNGIIL